MLIGISVHPERCEGFEFERFGDVLARADHFQIVPNQWLNRAGGEIPRVTPCCDLPHNCAVAATRPSTDRRSAHKDYSMTSLRRYGIALFALCASLSAHAAPGALDTASFGSGGNVITAIGTGRGVANAIALQPDGKIVVAGTCWNVNYDFCLVRYLPSGALDTSFGSSGTIVTAIGTGRDVARARALALQPDGKIVAAGECSDSFKTYFCLARYLPSGALDTSFGLGGTILSASGTNYGYANAVALQPDGKIVAAGSCDNGSSADFCLARYLPSGALDTSFNATGRAITAIGASYDFAKALALQPDGKIVAAGVCSNSSNEDFCLARFLTSGALDTSFGTGGKVLSAIGASHDDSSALAIQPDGKIVAAGGCRDGSHHLDFCLARFLTSGALDTSFNTTGTVITAIGASNDVAYALAVQPDGKIVAAGGCDNGSHENFCLARYLPSGTLDTTFGSGGTVTSAIATSENRALALALQPDGKIVAAGYCWNGSGTDFCLARYEGGPFDARNCSMDIDGDNQVLAMTDSLIHTRIALGMTGPAVLNGITFAAHATRTNWSAIQNYLVSQCGMSIAP